MIRLPLMTGTAASRIDIHEIADRLWEAADELCANSHLKAGEYSIPARVDLPQVADSRFSQVGSTVARSARPTTRPAASSTSPSIPAWRTSSS